MDILDFRRDLFPVHFPIPNEMRLALRAFEHRHDLKRRERAQIRRGQNPAVERMSEDATVMGSSALYWS